MNLGKLNVLFEQIYTQRLRCLAAQDYPGYDLEVAVLVDLEEEYMDCYGTWAENQKVEIKDSITAITGALVYFGSREAQIKEFQTRLDQLDSYIRSLPSKSWKDDLSQVAEDYPVRAPRPTRWEELISTETQQDGELIDETDETNAAEVSKAKSD